MMRQYRPPTVYSGVNLRRRSGRPRAVPLDAVSWWHVRQQIADVTAVMLTAGVITIALLAVAPFFWGH
jgi:hypothetical protein